MSKTIDVSITLSDSQYEALQVVWRMEAKSLDAFCSDAVIGGMQCFYGSLGPDVSGRDKLEAMIEG